MIDRLMVHVLSKALANQQMPLPTYDALLHRLIRQFEFTRRAPRGYQVVDLRPLIRHPLSSVDAQQRALLEALSEASRQSGVSFAPYIEAIREQDDMADIEDIMERVQHFALDRKTLLLLGHFQSC